jgi:hypothetical protein
MRAVACCAGEAAQLLAGLKSAKTDSADRYDLAEVIAAGHAYKIVTARGQAVACYVLARLGARLWIMAAAGRAAFDLTGAINALVAAQAAGCESIGFRTERPGLVRKAERLGYQVTRQEGSAYYLRKNIGNDFTS